MCSYNEIEFHFSMVNMTPEGLQPHCVVKQLKNLDLTATHLGRAQCGRIYFEIEFHFSIVNMTTEGLQPPHYVVKQLKNFDRNRLYSYAFR